MTVRDFKPVPNDVDFDSSEVQGWLSAVEDAFNINDHIAVTTPAAADEVDIFSVAANARRKVTLANVRRPTTPAGVVQTASTLYAGTGAPTNADGVDGDYYFRSDGGAATHIYFRSGGTWAGII